jgi:hypothetical protein
MCVYVQIFKCVSVCVSVYIFMYVKRRLISLNKHHLITV